METKTIDPADLYKALMLIDRGVPLKRLAAKFDVSLAYMAEIKITGAMPKDDGILLSRVDVLLKDSNKRSGVYQKTNRGRMRAMYHVNKAIDSGELVKPNKCDGCDYPDLPLYSVHEDEEKPLEVKFLCHGCFSEDFNNKPIANESKKA